MNLATASRVNPLSKSTVALFITLFFFSGVVGIINNGLFQFVGLRMTAYFLYTYRAKGRKTTAAMAFVGPPGTDILSRFRAVPDRSD